MSAAFFVAAALMTIATAVVIVVSKDAGQRFWTLVFNTFYIFLFFYAGFNL